MRFLRHVSIRRKLMTIIMLTSTVAMLLASGAFVGYEVMTFRQGTVRDVGVKAEIIGSQSTAALKFKDEAAAGEILNKLTGEKHIVSACLYTPGGQVLASYSRPDIATDFVPPQDPSERHVFSADSLELFRDIVSNSQAVGTIYLKSDLSELNARLRQYGKIVIIVLLAAFGVAWLVSFRLQQIVSQPVLDLATTTRSVSRHQDYSLRAAKHGNDELGDLIDSFNEMLAHIQRRDAELEQARKGLEQRVRERTQDLQQEIAERKQTEEKLRATAAQLERRNGELQDFAYVASHDLQEPLRKVQAFGDRLKIACAKSLGVEGRDYLERMQSAAKRMQLLIDDLLALSRVTTKANPFQPVDLGQAVREVLSDLEVRIQQSGGRVEVGELPTVVADPVQMRQLFQNLIVNALKFHGEDRPPMVQVRGHRLPHGSAADKPALEQCAIEVEDNGIGFDEKYLDRIFVMFQRLHSRGAHEGTGVGLAICRKIVDRHGGSITARSIPTHGSTFIVTLPIRQNGA